MLTEMPSMPEAEELGRFLIAFTVSAHVMLVNVNLLVDCELGGVLEVVVVKRLPLVNECVSLLGVSTKK